MAWKGKFADATKKFYIDQAKFYMNAFWVDGAKDQAEEIWKITNKFIALDKKKGKEGNELDEFEAHQLLEAFNETLTVLALRDILRSMDIDNNKRLSVLEYLLFKFKTDVKELVARPQGDNKEEIAEAQGKLEAVQKSLIDLTQKLDAQAKALVEQKKAEETARVALESQKKAEAELLAAVEDLHRQEEEYKKKIETLEAKANDESLSTVARNKAGNEVAQLKQEDPLPLRKAKITQEAAARKAEKERKAAEAKAKSAEESRLAAEEQTRLLEVAVRETEEKLAEAEAFLEKVKARGGPSMGDFWWMERELSEAQKYLPQRKQKK